MNPITNSTTQRKNRHYGKQQVGTNHLGSSLRSSSLVSNDKFRVNSNLNDKNETYCQVERKFYPILTIPGL
jgi:hypothetical protein